MSLCVEWNKEKENLKKENLKEEKSILPDSTTTICSFAFLLTCF
jgi:hypothetical protein